MNENAAAASLTGSLNGGMVLCLDGGGNGSGFSIARRYSTSFVQRIFLHAATLVAVLGVGSVFACFGAWPVLLFSIAEVAAILFVWSEIERHRNDHEVVALDEQTVDVSVCRRELRQRYSFQRYWAQLMCSDDGEHIVIRSHGRQVEIGIGLSKGDKRLIFRYLAARLGQGQRPFVS